jgi:hypothetical protein
LFVKQISFINILYVDKIQFRRKGGWITIRRSWPFCISVKIGYGHPIRYFYSHFGISRFKKYLKFHNLCLIDINKLDLLYTIFKIIYLRYLNKYTWRGFKLARFLLIKKSGKESQYSKLKSKIF